MGNGAHGHRHYKARVTGFWVEAYDNLIYRLTGTQLGGQQVPASPSDELEMKCKCLSYAWMVYRVDTYLLTRTLYQTCIMIAPVNMTRVWLSTARSCQLFRQVRIENAYQPISRPVLTICMQTQDMPKAGVRPWSVKSMHALALWLLTVSSLYVSYNMADIFINKNCRVHINHHHPQWSWLIVWQHTRSQWGNIKRTDHTWWWKDVDSGWN